jgi:hypothetical protein
VLEVFGQLARRSVATQVSGAAKQRRVVSPVNAVIYRHDALPLFGGVAGAPSRRLPGAHRSTEINGHEARWVARLIGGAHGRTELSDAPDATGGAPRLDTAPHRAVFHKSVI